MKKLTWIWALVALTGCQSVSPEATPSTTDPANTTKKGEDRAQYIHTILQNADTNQTAQDPAMVPGKLARMRIKPFDYFRGNLEIAWQDFIKSDITKRNQPPHILLVGDPHIENIGAYLRSDATLALAFNDFDAARPGDFRFDLLRLAVSFELLARTSELKSKARQNLTEDLLEAYLKQFNAQTKHHEAPVDLEENKVISKTCLICEDLLSRARRDGDSNKTLSKYTRLRDETRILLDHEFKPDMLTPEVIDDDLEPVSETELTSLTEALQHYPQTLQNPLTPSAPQLKIKGIARLLGKGVSSYALLRYVALIEGPSTSPIDDLLLDIKATPNPSNIPCPAQHIASSQRTLQGTPTHDPWLGWACHNQQTLLIQSLSGYQKSARFDRITEKLSKDKWDTKDLKAFAQAAGRLLASTHLRSKTPSGQPAAPIIEAYLRQDPLLQTITNAVPPTADTTEADWQRLSQNP